MKSLVARQSLAGGLLLLGGAPALAAQSMRSYEYARERQGERELTARIDFAAGKLRLGPGAPGQLYELVLRYDAERFEPVGSYDAGAAAVRLGVEGARRGGIRVDKQRALPQTATVQLSPVVDLRLEVALGAAEASLDLGGLRLAELEVRSGASRTELDFSRANPRPCGSARVSSGAGELTIRNAGNSRCAAWRVEGGVGSATLDLAGEWPADARLELNLAVGGVTLVAPKQLGLRVTLSGFLADFEGSGFSKSGKIYTSAGYERAARKLDVVVSSALGGVTVEWR